MKNALYTGKFFWICTTIMLAITSTISCKKEKKEEPVIHDQMTLLTAKKWYRSSDDENPSTLPKVQYYYEEVADCDRDDVVQYMLNGTINWDNGTKHCIFNEVPRGVRDYKVDFSTMTIEPWGEKMRILDLTETQLKLAMPTPASVGGDFIYIYKH